MAIDTAVSAAQKQADTITPEAVALAKERIGQQYGMTVTYDAGTWKENGQAVNAAWAIEFDNVLKMAQQELNLKAAGQDSADLVARDLARREADRSARPNPLMGNPFANPGGNR